MDKLLDMIIRKEENLKEELYFLNDEERNGGLAISIIGSIEIFEDFLIGYAFRVRKGQKLVDEDLQIIKNYRPLENLEIKNWLLDKKDKYPHIVSHIDLLQILQQELIVG